MKRLHARHWLRERVPPALRREARAALRRLAHAGLRRHCPVCAARCRRFLPGARTGRPESTCPVCGSQERHRSIWPFLLEHTALLRSPLRVLHVAPEACFERRLRRHPRVDLVTADLARPDVDVRTDLQKLVFDDASFDLLLCNHVLEHVADDRAAMREMFRVLRPGGLAVVTVPGPDVSLGFPADLARSVEAPAGCGPEERRRRFGHPGHLRQYGLDLCQRLAEAGFDAQRVEYGSHLDASECERRRVYAWYPIQLCRRPG